MWAIYDITTHGETDAKKNIVNKEQSSTGGTMKLDVMARQT